jgi:hypothetical protein
MKEQNNSTEEDNKYLLTISKEDSTEYLTAISVGDKQELVTLVHKLSVVIRSNELLHSTMRMMLSNDIPEHVKEALKECDEHITGERNARTE